MRNTSLLPLLLFPSRELHVRPATKALPTASTCAYWWVGLCSVPQMRMELEIKTEGEAHQTAKKISEDHWRFKLQKLSRSNQETCTNRRWYWSNNCVRYCIRTWPRNPLNSNKNSSHKFKQSALKVVSYLSSFVDWHCSRRDLPILRYKLFWWVLHVSETIRVPFKDLQMALKTFRFETCTSLCTFYIPCKKSESKRFSKGHGFDTVMSAYGHINVGSQVTLKTINLG